METIYIACSESNYGKDLLSSLFDTSWTKSLGFEESDGMLVGTMTEHGIQLTPHGHNFNFFPVSSYYNKLASALASDIIEKCKNQEFNQLNNPGRQTFPIKFEDIDANCNEGDQSELQTIAFLSSYMHNIAVNLDTYLEAAVEEKTYFNKDSILDGQRSLKVCRNTIDRELKEHSFIIGAGQSAERVHLRELSSLVTFNEITQAHLAKIDEHNEAWLDVVLKEHDMIPALLEMSQSSPCQTLVEAALNCLYMDPELKKTITSQVKQMLMQCLSGFYSNIFCEIHSAFNTKANAEIFYSQIVEVLLLLNHGKERSLARTPTNDAIIRHNKRMFTDLSQTISTKKMDCFNTLATFNQAISIQNVPIANNILADILDHHETEEAPADSSSSGPKRSQAKHTRLSHSITTRKK